MPSAKRKPKPDAFTAYVNKVAKQADSAALATSLGALTKLRLGSRSKRQVADTMRAEAKPQRGWDLAKPPSEHNERQRRSPRRLGRYRAYTPTAKPDVSRLGTFRHYMLSTIRKHSDTVAANNEHADCDRADWASKKLDFNWAADNGYITLN